MNARQELYDYATVAFKETGVPPVVHAHVTRLLDAFAHELAGQIRAWAAVEVGGEIEEIYGYAADLIDPEADDESAGPVRPDQETTP